MIFRVAWRRRDVSFSPRLAPEFLFARQRQLLDSFNADSAIFTRRSTSSAPSSLRAGGVGFGNFTSALANFMLQALKASLVLPRRSDRDICARGLSTAGHRIQISCAPRRPGRGLLSRRRHPRGAAKFSFPITDTLGECFQFRAQDGHLVVDALQLDKVRNRRVHEQQSSTGTRQALREP